MYINFGRPIPLNAVVTDTLVETDVLMDWKYPEKLAKLADPNKKFPAEKVKPVTGLLTGKVTDGPV